MANGWAADGAVQSQIDDTVADAVTRARQQLVEGESELYCQECGDEIPLARRNAIKGVKYCIQCQEKLEKQQHTNSGYNRRGSKDSQLR